jgi:hypothetical protein
VILGLATARAADIAPGATIVLFASATFLAAAVRDSARLRSRPTRTL